MAVALKTLLAEIDRYLEPAKINDYCPNGLQVEGRDSVQRIVTGVTACQALLDAAADMNADMVLVHHGFFWKNENPCVVGMKQRRLKTLLINEMSLVAYHLPLDIHPEVGNNAQLAQRLGLLIDGPLEANNPRSIGLIGHLPEPLQPADFAAHVGRALGREPLLVAGNAPIKRVAWCTGGAQGYIEHAIAAGVDAYITGEVSESTVHSARENGLSFLAAGHHATERYGVQALGNWLAQRFALEHLFIEIENPV